MDLKNAVSGSPLSYKTTSARSGTPARKASQKLPTFASDFLKSPLKDPRIFRESERDWTFARATLRHIPEMVERLRQEERVLRQFLQENGEETSDRDNSDVEMEDNPFTE